MEVRNDTSLNIKALYSSNYAMGVKDFLNTLPVETLYSVAQTACTQKILPEDKAEAVEVILLYTPDIDRFFSYRRFTMDILLKYLHINGQLKPKQATHQHLVAAVKKLWVVKFSECSQNLKNNSSSSESNSGKLSKETDSSFCPHMESIKSDKFSCHFVEWFYTSLNNIHNSSLQENNLHASMFCLNASLDLYMMGTNSSNDIHSVGAEDCKKALEEFIFSNHFMFTPNLETGIQAAKSSHGLINIFCCGTLHQERNFIGIFEQEFGLVQSPLDKNWKIFYSKANFRHGMFQVPKLPPFEVFEIEF